MLWIDWLGNVIDERARKIGRLIAGPCHGDRTYVIMVDDDVRRIDWQDILVQRVKDGPCEHYFGNE